tara:strand:+ start:14 stop:613 length:600 start_codon:yes stop_codon:yes gene_type:complete
MFMSLYSQEWETTMGLLHLSEWSNYQRELITSGMSDVLEIRDFRMNNAGDYKFPSPPEAKKKREDIFIDKSDRDFFHNFNLEGHPNYNVCFLQWFIDELLKDKEGDFRHDLIIVEGGQWMDSDVNWQSDNITINDEFLNWEDGFVRDKDFWKSGKFSMGDEITVISFKVYTSIRIRNPYFSRLSFTANEHMWDELAAIL